MSPNGTDDTSKQANPDDGIRETEGHGPFAHCCTHARAAAIPAAATFPYAAASNATTTSIATAAHSAAGRAAEQLWAEDTQAGDLDWSGFSKFSWKETSAGGGADFMSWGLRFLHRLGAAQKMSDGDWPEEFKILALRGKLEGTALVYVKKMMPGWTAVSNTLEYVTNRMLMLYMTPIPSAKGMELMSKEKDPSKIWPEHYQFLVYVAERSGNSEQCVLQCLCRSAPLLIQNAMLTHSAPTTSNRQLSSSPLQSSTKLAQYAITTKLAVTEEGVQDAAVVAEFQMAEVKCRGANGSTVHVNKVGTFKLKTSVDGNEVAVEFSDVYFANNLMGNIVSYRRLEKQGVFLERRNSRCYVIREADQLKIFEVYRSNDVLTVGAIGEKAQGELVHVMNAAVQDAGTALSSAVAETTLLELHQRLGHIAYDTAERMADAKESGIKLTDRAPKLLNLCSRQAKQKQPAEEGHGCERAHWRQVSEAENQASNGKAEQIHRTVLNMARCMLYANGLPLYFWGDAIEYPAYVLNKGSCSANPKRLSPIEMLTGTAPNLADEVMFGSSCTAYRNPAEGAGHRDTTTGAPPARARPDKTNTKSKQKLSKRNKLANRKKHLAAGQDTAGPKGVATEEQPLPAEEETETRMHPRFMGANHVPVARVKGVPIKDPKNYRDAMEDSRAKKWEQAIREGIAALERNETWQVIKKPRNAKLLHNKWVFKLKTHADGPIERYKYGVNYTYTFAAVLDLASSRLILVIARKWGVPARHGDVPSAYFKADKGTNIENLLRIQLGVEISKALFNTAKADKFFAVMQVVENKDLGVVSKFLGISFTYDDIAGWELDQAQGIQEMLEKFQLDKAAPSWVPIGGEHDEDDGGELLPVGGARTPQHPTVQTSQSLVGSLLRIARKASLNKDRVFIEAYRDADYVADKSDRKSASGGVVVVAGIVVGWLCKKQSCVALSTMEAGFVAASQTAEVLSIVELLQEIGIMPCSSSVLYVDCSGAAVACVRGRRRLTESEYESVRSLSTDS
ncbi:unnamed protein product [Phytophthora fragariaefolia]|uniref:Unnamed protein product n=1 Tax=Phytophthora fragariaefolia TaxID=1490495 RepID=A0A9W6XCL0_9STRA|nr:unnamed protein product [Phytophthora fragariaefolia]